MEKVYNKLVRDKIPEIIKNNNGKPITRILDDNEYKQELEKKLYEEYLEVLSLIPEDKLKILFNRAAKLGVGIELNASDMNFAEDEAEIVLRIYKTAKECGCKFYLGSDAHHPRIFNNVKMIFEKAVALLELGEDDKFIIQ